MGASQEQLRTAVITALTQRNKTTLGRTAIMKLLYFLQELKGVPLGYSYRLYNYGPYDSQVLDDLRIATDADAVTASVFQWQGGMGYEIKPGDKADELVGKVSGELNKFTDDLDWVIKEFGNRAASDLEVASTIIYLDRSNLQHSKLVCDDEMVSRVREVKPHYAEPKIRAILTDLKSRKLLEAVA